MVARLRLGKAGRIVLPKPLRQELQLGPGDALELESCGEQITLRPLRASAPLRKKQGVWVYRSGEPLSHAEVEDTLRQVRREREEAHFGKGR